MVRGESPIYERGLGDLITSNRASLIATTNYELAVSETQATFVVVPTPSKPSGGFSLRYVKSAMRALGKALADKPSYHLVVLTSTVMPGSINPTLIRVLETSSGKTCPRDFGFCYNPEFIALGNVIEGLRRPDFFLVGESDESAGNALAEILGRVSANSAPVQRMTFFNAEVAKIAVNSFVTMKMSFANTLAEVCERLPSGDVDTITRAIGLDKRIGTTYLKGAIGYGGPCFPRDNAAFASFAERLGLDPGIARATDRVNRRQVGRVLRLIRHTMPKGSEKVGILGLTYKPDTNVIEASQTLMVANALLNKGFEVHVFDPALSPHVLPRSVRLLVEGTAEECVANSDLCVIGTPWESFSRIDYSHFSGKVVLDCWRVLEGDRLQGKARYVALGRDMTSLRARKN